jgi:hypothetical protein
LSQDAEEKGDAEGEDSKSGEKDDVKDGDDDPKTANKFHVEDFLDSLRGEAADDEEPDDYANNYFDNGEDDYDEGKAEDDE